MNKVIILLLCVPVSLALACCKSTKPDLTYNSETLKLFPVTENSYIHTSYLRLKSGASIDCNGLVYVNNGSAIVLDTPPDRKTTVELLNWLTVSNPLRITGLVVNHFHDDCLGGIEEFHLRGILSYANQSTLEHVNDPGKKPQKGFEEALTLMVGNSEVINRYFGAAHSGDNIVSYIPEENLLFGGCMIKSLEAPKGNLNDANLGEWANTVREIKATYPDLKIVVPGHGASGDKSLLNYTIQLFLSYQEK